MQVCFDHIQRANSSAQMEYLRILPDSAGLNLAVYLLDCYWETFVLVGKDARAQRRDISLALTTAKVSFLPVRAQTVE
jgi:hypothetical protein